MKPEEVRKIIIVQAVEQTDEKGVAVHNLDRTDAAAVAGAPLPKNSSSADQHSFLAKRSEAIIPRLLARFPDMSDWLLASGDKHRLGLLSGALFVVAAGVGFLTNELGPDKRINILSFPLLGILAWNIIIYLREVVLFFRHRDTLFSGYWTSACVRFISDPEKRTLADPGNPSPLEAARKLYKRRWYELQFDVLGARIKSLLHFVALTLAAAAIGGMYIKGLANEYRAVWESTFITDASQLRPFLQFVLGPAVAISGDQLPSIEELNAMHWLSGGDEVGGENAARWIHWYAITIGLFVILPRTLLSVLWRIRSSHLLRNLPYRETCPHYFDHLLAISTGDARKLQVIPYSLNPSEEVKQVIVNRIESTLQCPVEIDWLPTIDFGNEEDPVNPSFDAGSRLAILFNFAATPEKETHLTLHQTLSGQAPNPVDYVILDTTGFDHTAADFPDAGKRRDDRLTAWEKLFSGTKVQFLLTGGDSVPSSSSES